MVPEDYVSARTGRGPRRARLATRSRWCASTRAPLSGDIEPLLGRPIPKGVIAGFEARPFDPARSRSGIARGGRAQRSPAGVRRSARRSTAGGHRPASVAATAGLHGAPGPSAAPAGSGPRARIGVRPRPRHRQRSAVTRPPSPLGRRPTGSPPDFGVPDPASRTAGQMNRVRTAPARTARVRQTDGIVRTARAGVVRGPRQNGPRQNGPRPGLEVTGRWRLNRPPTGRRGALHRDRITHQARGGPHGRLNAAIPGEGLVRRRRARLTFGLRRPVSCRPNPVDPTGQAGIGRRWKARGCPDPARRG